MKLPIRSVLRLGICAGLLSFVSGLSAQDAATGTIEGRVDNPATGQYLEMVRISVGGVSTATFTDTSGEYRLTKIPAGSTKITAFRTGFAAQTQLVSVAAGQTTQQNFSLTGTELTPTTEGTVKLDKFVVSESAEMGNAAIEINTKRFANNLVNVASSDQFGPIATGNLGDVVKSLPGITVGLGGMGDTNTISIDGVPTTSVPILYNSFSLASANGGTSRLVGIHMVGLNSISRMQVEYTPTAETPGGALAGSVTMVPRSSFEYARPVYNASINLLLRPDHAALGATPGPRLESSHKVLPEFDFSVIVPFNRRFGITVTASTSPLYSEQQFAQNTWSGVSAATNGGTLPDVTPDSPYLSNYIVRNATRRTRQTANSATVDYKFTQHDVISFNFLYSTFDWQSDDKNMTFFVNRVLSGNFGPTFTHGFAGAGEVRQASLGQDVHDITYMPVLTYRHNGEVWTAAAAASVSHATRHRRDISDGIVANALVRRTGVTMSFDDIGPLGPKKITITDGTTGAPVDPYNLNSYSIDSATGNEIDNVDLQRGAYAWLQRSFGGKLPLTVKTGLDIRQAVRSNRMDLPAFTFSGPNKSASLIPDNGFSPREGPLGTPAIQWLSNDRLGRLLQSNPEYFTFDPTARYKSDVLASQHIEEVISTGYIRGDMQFFNSRLKVTVGLRGEQTNVKGQGALVDPTLNYQRDASGKVMLDGTGKPLSIATAPLDVAKLTYIDLGLHTNKEYMRWFPSINGSFNITDNLLARAGYYQSVGRPDYSQYAGSITLPNLANLPSPSNRTIVNNVNIKAWQAQSVKASLEYYFQKVGLISVSGYVRQFKNFFGTTVFTPAPDFLTKYSLDPTVYGAYDVSTQYNIPNLVHASGFDINYKQALTFLPEWAQGFQVFGNISVQHLTGDVSDSLAGFTPRFGNAGISFSRPKYVLKLRVNYQGRQRLGPMAAGRSIDPGTYNWNSPRSSIDVNAEYYFYKKYSVFASMTNASNAPGDAWTYGPNTPAYAQFRSRLRYGAMCSIGMKGTF